MVFLRFLLIGIFALLYFSGCATKEYKKSEAKLIILKTPQIKFADTGYIRHNGDAVQLELYSGGQPIKRIEIGKLICVDDEGCLSKSSFNSDYLHKSYPDNLLLHVILGQTLFESENLIKTDDGFEQKIRSKEYDISYKVNKNEIYFKDKKNHILIRFKTILL